MHRSLAETPRFDPAYDLVERPPLGRRTQGAARSAEDEQLRPRVAVEGNDEIGEAVAPAEVDRGQLGDAARKRPQLGASPAVAVGRKEHLQRRIPKSGRRDVEPAVVVEVTRHDPVGPQ